MTGETFGQMLRRLRLRTPGYSRGNRFAPACSVMSMNAVGRKAGLDPAYIYRLEAGRRSPTRPVVLALARTLELDEAETDRLLFAAGLAPQADWQARYEELVVAIRVVRSAANTLGATALSVCMQERAG